MKIKNCLGAQPKYNIGTLCGMEEEFLSGQVSQLQQRGHKYKLDPLPLLVSGHEMANAP